MNQVVKNLQSLLFKSQNKFSGFCNFAINLGGPYNPYKYKDYLVPKNYPSNKVMYDTVRNQDKVPPTPVRNMRHINPVRQSGPLPAYSGSYTM